jgi:hypothetical protein
MRIKSPLNLSQWMRKKTGFLFAPKSIFLQQIADVALPNSNVSNDFPLRKCVVLFVKFDIKSENKCTAEVLPHRTCVKQLYVKVQIIKKVPDSYQKQRNARTQTRTFEKYSNRSEHPLPASSAQIRSTLNGGRSHSDV